MNYSIINNVEISSENPVFEFGNHPADGSLTRDAFMCYDSQKLANTVESMDIRRACFSDSGSTDPYFMYLCARLQYQAVRELVYRELRAL